MSLHLSKIANKLFQAVRVCRRHFKFNENTCRQQNKCDWKSVIWFRKGRKHYGKRRKYCLSAFSPLAILFSKGLFVRVVKSQDCVVKSYEYKIAIIIVHQILCFGYRIESPREGNSEDYPHARFWKRTHGIWMPLPCRTTGALIIPFQND